VERYSFFHVVVSVFALWLVVNIHGVTPEKPRHALKFFIASASVLAIGVLMGAISAEKIQLKSLLLMSHANTVADDMGAIFIGLGYGYLLVGVAKVVRYLGVTKF
jgi:hypothetical protein